MKQYNKFNHAPCHAYFNNFGKLIIEDATMYYYPNFSARDINGIIPNDDEIKDGLRSFKVFIDDREFAEQLKNDGWSISMTRPDEDGNSFYLLKCKVSYRYFAPEIYRHYSGNPNVHFIDKEHVENIDSDDILNESLNIQLKGSNYNTKAGKSGISAYVEKFHYMVEGDPFADKYAPSLFDGVHPEE